MIWMTVALPASRRASSQGGRVQVTTVSAANYASVVAPDSIAAAFGLGLATQVAQATTQPLPTSLAGTTVRINGQLAGIFFVSATQVNYLIPPGVPTGMASVVVTAGDGTVSTGNAQIAPVAPALFTADSSGQGALASLLLRVRQDGQQIYEPLTRHDGTGYVTRPIDFGEAGDQLFLILFLTGIRHAPPSGVRVSMGGVEYAPLFVGAQGGFEGLDQINAPLPRNFGGRGRITLLVKASGYGVSNAAEFEIGSGAQSLETMQIGAPAHPVLAGEEVEISGAGFAANPRENNVQIVADDGLTAKAEALAVSDSAIRIRVPFGAGTGQLKVSRGQVEASARIQVRTSVSGFVERAVIENGQIVRTPISGARVRLRERPEIERVTDAEGSFVMPDMTASLRTDFEILPPASGSLNFPNKPFSLRVRAGRDNQLLRGDEQTLISGVTFPLLGDSEASNAERNADVATASPDQNLTLTYLEPGRTPANLPVSHFSARIAQIAPFGQIISPGARLSFPNADAIPAGAQARLFKFDLTTGSETLGQFIEIGLATVTADGQRVETAANAITEGSYYFASIARPVATISGRVVESDGRPAPRAIVQTRGQSTFTDGFGGFVLNNVPVMKTSGDRARVEISYQRPDGRVSRKDSSEVELTAGAFVTIRPDIALDPVTANFPPVILAPASLVLTAGETREFDLVVTDPDSGQAPQVSVSGDATPFTTLSNQGPGIFRLRFAPGANAAGSYSLALTAADIAVSVAQNIAVTVTQPNNNAPTAQGQAITTPEDTSRAITLSGTDPGGRALSYVIVNGPSRGSLSGTAPNLEYIPAPNFNGADSFTFKVSNGSGESTAATVYIGVSPANDAPVISAPATVVVNAGEQLNLIVTAMDVDGDQSLGFAAPNLPPGATFVDLGGSSRQLIWTPTITQTGTYPVSVTVMDSGAPQLSDTEQTRITVVAQWARTSGPDGGKILSFLSAGTDLFAGTLGGGVFRSTDGGKSWIELNDGLSDTYVHALAVNGATILAGTENSGVFRSTDRGVTWRPSNQGIENVYVRSLAVSGATILAGAHGAGVFRSTDGGASWRPANQGLPVEAYISAFAVVGSTVFAALEFGGDVYRSTDNGASWAQVNNGLPTKASVLALAVSGQRLYAGLERDDDSIGGVFVTTNGGASWSAINTGLPNGAFLIVRSLAAQDNMLLAGTEYDGVYRSINQGQNWEPVNTGLPPSLIVRALALHGGAALAGTFGPGVFRSTNAGTNWTAANGGLTSPFVLSLAVSGADLFAGTKGGGVFRSSDQGASWIAVNQGLTDPDVSALLVTGDKIFAGTQDYVFRSTDRGENWASARNGMDVHSRIRALAAHRGMIFAGTDSGGVFRSADDGTTWTPVNSGLTTQDIYALAANDQFIFAGTIGGGVFRSADRGANWARVNSGLPKLEIYALKVVGESLIASTPGGVFRSRDQGQNWLPSNLQQPAFAFESLGANIFAATYDKGVFLSTDQGESWTEINAGLTNKFTQALTTNGQALFVGFPGGAARLSGEAQSWTAASSGLLNQFVNAALASGDHLFAGTLGGGVFRSSDRGQSWTAASAGLPANANIQSLVSNGATLWAATFGDGVYVLDNQRAPNASWRAVSNGLANRLVNKLFLSGATLYAGTDGGVFRSNNGGSSWTALTAGLINLRVVSFTFTNGTLYAGTDGGGVFRLNLDGASWTQVNRGLTSQSVTALGASGGALYAGTTGGGVCISRDGGEMWTAVNNALPANLNVFAFAISVRKVYTGSIYGVFVTEDEGQSWKQVNAGLLNTFVTGLAVSGDKLFASTASGGVFVSPIPQ